MTKLNESSKFEMNLGKYNEPQKNFIECLRIQEEFKKLL